ncbi:hypothetical protein CPB97_009974 [Podila verticillata]|nr:hypothetical protein CPB97_009974 [Podila verticillata]
MLSDSAGSKLPSFNLIQHIRNASLLPLKLGLVLTCVVSMMLLGFNMTRLRFTNNSSLNTIGRSERWPICPFPANAEDVCIHSGVNVADLVAACGALVATIGSCQDRFYDRILVPTHAMETVSEHTHRMIVQGIDIGREVDVFVQTRSRWVIDTMGARGYEILTTFADKDRVALQQDLDRLQNRCDRFFNGVINPHGFGSYWHTLGLGLAYGLYYNMTLLTPDAPQNFIPLTTCSEADMKRAFRAYPPETKYTQWNNSTINFKSRKTDVNILATNGTLIMPEYAVRGYHWWRSVLTYYAVRPNAHMRETIRNAPTFATPCMAIHVRHSDKAFEAQLLDFSRYMEEAKRFKAETGISSVYLMTDDDQVIQSTKNYSDFQFHYRDVPRTNQGWIADVQAGISKKQQEVDFLIDIYSAARCQRIVVTYSSNVGRLISELAYAMGNKEPDVVSLDEGWKMDP